MNRTLTADPQCEQPVVQVEPGHASKVDVEHKARWLAVERRAEVFVSRRVRLDGDTGSPQYPGERRADRRIVVDDGDPSGFLEKERRMGLRDPMM